MLIQSAASQLFSLLPLIIALAVLYIVVKVGMGALNSGGGVSGGSRRSFLSHITEIVAVGLVVAFLVPTALDSLSEASSDLKCLNIYAGQTTTVTAEDEEYSGVCWEDTGTLDWDEGGTFTLIDQQ